MQRDLFNDLLVSSDPYISSSRKTHDKKCVPLTFEVKQLLILNKEESESEDEYEGQFGHGTDDDHEEKSDNV